MPNAPTCVLMTLDYPPERGGVARYLGNLVTASEGGIGTVYVPDEHECTGPGEVKAMPFFWPGIPRWAPLIRFFYNQGHASNASVLVSHVLPVGTAAWLASFFGGASYHVLLHGLDFRLASQNSRKRWLLTRILKRARTVFTNSAHLAQEVKALNSALHPIVVTPGVEPQIFPAREASRARFQIPAQVTQLIAVTRLVPRKGLDMLLTALAFLPDHVHLAVIGAGQDEKRLRELALAFGSRVRFETSVTDLERNAWYAAADLFVLPTRDEGTDVEGFGIVFLEAALAGLPVVAGRGGGVEEAVLHEETGLLVDPRDPAAIAAAIKRLIDDPSLARHLREQARVRAERDFSWQDRWKRIASALFL